METGNQKVEEGEEVRGDGKTAETFKSGAQHWTGSWKGIDPTDPMAAFEALSKFQTVETVDTANPKRRKPEGTLRIVCISDTHSLERNPRMIKIPDGDVIVHAGDFSNTGTKKEVKQFAEWFTALPHKHKVVIAGNHDTIMHKEWYTDQGASKFHGKPTGTTEECREFFSGVTYLEDSGATIEGLKFWGSPWQPEFCDWAFNLDRGTPLQEKWDLIPSDTDVLLTHGPPIMHGDQCRDGFRAGCVNLLHDIQTRIKPKLHVFGHIHEGYGATTDGTTTYVNASTCTSRYRPTHLAVVVDVPVK